MRQYRYELNDNKGLWIDLDRILTISEPCGINNMGFGGMYYGFAITLAFQDDPLYIRHEINNVLITEGDKDAGARGQFWCAKENPEHYTDQTAKFKDRWQALYDAWVSK